MFLRVPYSTVKSILTANHFYYNKNKSKSQ
nr:MAG TPA: hypothetical protein [Caudoviricetes sp.]